MEDTFYTGDYVEYNGPNIINTGTFRIRASSPQSVDEQADFLKRQMGREDADIRITASKMITKDEYVALGGSPDAPWFGPFGSSKKGDS